MWTLPDTETYPSLGCCIFCGPTDLELTDEHIIPRAIGGKLIIDDATCKACQKIINEEFEHEVLDKMLYGNRALLGIKSRKTNKPKDFIKVRLAPSEPAPKRSSNDYMFKDTEDWKVSDHPIVLNHVKFEPPGMILTPPRPDPSTIVHFRLHVNSEEDHRKFVEMGEQNKAPMILANFSKYARMLAKIAFCAAVAKLGINSFRSFITEFIIKEDDRIFYFVGSKFKDPLRTDALHEIKLYIRNDTLYCALTLFKSYSGPQHITAVGAVTDKLGRWCYTVDTTLRAPEL
jgi:HNH endonuclease